MLELIKAYYHSPIGIIEIIGTDDYIKSLNFVNKEEAAEAASGEVLKACRQLDEYFKGERESFDLKLSLEGTDFQNQVWQQLLRIPYGETTTYSDLAEAIGRPKAVRAVGSANGSNPISIIVPCHRVIGRDGSLTGYGGGIDRKAWLLKHEKN